MYYKKQKASKGEKLVANYLKSKKIRYYKEKQFDWLINKDGNNLRFDFYLPKYRVAIEFDGIYHYTNNRQKYNDRCKNNCCKTKKIPLLRIPYWKLGVMNILIDQFLGDLKNL